VIDTCTHGIGMHVLVFDPCVKIDAARYPDAHIADASITALREADVVTLHALLPHTMATPIKARSAYCTM
jgi:phosphoglycerate dehydrogenase-like enzyme